MWRAPPPECTVSGGYRSGAAGSSPMALLAPDCCPCCLQKCPGNRFSSLCDIFWLVTAQKRGGIRRCCLFVRTVRLELTQANAHYPLKVACLPFHHVRITLGLQSYAEFIYLQIFRPKNPIFSVRIRSPSLPHSTFLPSASLPRPRSSSAPVSLTLVELGLSCTQHGTGKAWLTNKTGCARHSVRGSPGAPNGMRSAGCSVRGMWPLPYNHHFWGLCRWAFIVKFVS